MFQSTTIFEYQGKNLEVDFGSVDAGIILHRLDEAICADDSTEVNVTAVKTVIDDLILRPLIDSFKNSDISEGLRKTYCLYDATDVAKVVSEIENLRNSRGKGSTGR